MTQSDDNTPTTDEATAPAAAAEESAPAAGEESAPAKKTARKATARKATASKAPARKAAARKTAEPAGSGGDGAEAPAADAVEASAPPAKKASTRRTTKRAATRPDAPTGAQAPAEPETQAPAPTEETASGAPMVLFQAPEKTAPARKRTRKAAAPEPADETPASASPDQEQGQVQGHDQPESAPEQQPARKRAAKKTTSRKASPAASETPEAADQATPAADTAADSSADESASAQDDSAESGSDGEGGRRRRRRGGRRRRKGSGEDSKDGAEAESAADSGRDADSDGDDDSGDGDEGGSRRRRTRNRQPKSPEDEITSVSGSTRLEAKKQRRREGREAGRRRAPIVSEAEFLARRESVDRVMVIRQRGDLTQIGVLEDKVLVEHYVARESQTSLIGNIYLGRVQNVLPSMEAAFVDIGKGRNAVLYAGEVNWKALGHKDGQQRKIESVLSSGQTVLVQVTKDPVGHKGARLTGQISLPGRFLVYVPDGTTSGISRKLPDTERSRLKALLKEIVPDTAGVIVRTAAEGASEEELTHDVERLTARWADIDKRVQAGKSPELLYGEPDLTLKVVRDLFTEDFGRLVVQGDDAWDLVEGYVSHVAPDLRDRLERFEVAQDGPDAGKDVFAAYRVDEQIAKGLDRKVWLPSGGSLVIDRTEAMTVVDVNTGKFTGSGGNLEETVTKNNLEAAEEIVRQLRLRDIGGIIVVDFIDMVLESNRDLVLRRLVECLGRDRTRHQVAEVTSLGLVQMTRKRIGTGLLEAFGEECQHCKGRGVLIHDHPIEPSQKAVDEPRGRRSRGGRSRGKGDQGNANGTAAPAKPSPKDLAGTRPPVEPEHEQGAPDSAPEAAAGESGAESVAGPPAEPRPEPAAQPAAEPAAQPAAEPAAASTDDVTGGQAATQPAEQPVDTAPKVVSRRRRAAARPAGPPAGAPTDDQGAQPVPADEPVAGPGEDPATPDTPTTDSETADSETADDPGSGSLVHVPVKKKGSRKR